MPQVQQIIGKILADNGYEKVRFAEDHSGVIDILRQRETDVTMLDFKMATENTFALLDDILLDRHLYRHPILLLGNKAPIGLIDDAMRLGARDYLNKPFTPYLLMVRLEKILFGAPPKVIKRTAKAGTESAHLGEEVEALPAPHIASQQALAKKLFLDGHKLLKQNYPEKALKKLAAAARVNTLFPEAYKALAEVFRSQGDLARSAQFLSKAAETHAWLGQNDKAKEAFTLSCKVDPACPNPFKTVADHMTGHMIQREVARAYEQALKLTPKDPSVRVALSRSYMESGDKDKAAETLAPIAGKGEIPEDMQHVIMQVRRNDTNGAGRRRQRFSMDGIGPYSGEERRRAKRIPLAEYSARLPHRDDSFQVFDVCALGISFKHGGESFEIGQKLSFDLLTLDGPRAKKVKAVVRRLTPLVVGCELVGLNNKQRDAFTKFLPKQED
ncbi:PilZ domain-containing protein [Desulfovibrio ferrophilus]|nr:PilZ domain-containing protein [Desulfovibrio ferrophilus]